MHDGVAISTRLLREEHLPSLAALRVKMKEARKKAGDDDFSRLLCHEYSLCAYSVHVRTHMRTNKLFRFLVTVYVKSCKYLF